MTKAVKMLYALNVIGKSAGLFIWSMLCLPQHNVAVISNLNICFTNTRRGMVHFAPGSTRPETCTSRWDSLAAVQRQTLSDRTAQTKEATHLYLTELVWQNFRKDWINVSSSKKILTFASYLLFDLIQKTCLKIWRTSPNLSFCVKLYFLNRQHELIKLKKTNIFNQFNNTNTHALFKIQIW